jgi:glycerol-3-phosphate dehydrogenase
MIERNPNAAVADSYDLAVIGGGIHGAAVALEAAQRSLRVLLLERADFGSGASGNSLRILHGGLRYLQSADLVRFRESVAARRWYASTFPALVEPLSCLMPLYRQGLKRLSVMQLALAANDVLSMDRNAHLSEEVKLPSSNTFGPLDTESRFKLVRRSHLEGSALWYDYRMRSSERVLIEMLRWACRLGVRALNYVDVQRVASSQGGSFSIEAVDQRSGAQYTFRAQRVCSCTGSNARALSAAVDREHESLFVPSLAFNVLFDCEALSRDALAVAAPEAGAPVYFLCPSPFGIWAGTEHVGRPDRCLDARVSEAELDDFIGRINRAIPYFGLSPQSVRRVCSGLLPVRSVGGTDLTNREVIIDHAVHGGPKGLYSVTGIKFTTAHKVAVNAVRKMLGSQGKPAPRKDPQVPAISPSTPVLIDAARVTQMDTAMAVNLIRQVAAEESVHDPEDFLLRRTNWTFTAADMGSLEHLVRTALEKEAGAQYNRSQFGG